MKKRPKRRPTFVSIIQGKQEDLKKQYSFSLKQINSGLLVRRLFQKKRVCLACLFFFVFFVFFVLFVCLVVCLLRAGAGVERELV